MLSRDSMTFEGFRSRWMIGAGKPSWSSATASHSRGNTSHASATEASQRYTTSASVSPPMCSITTTKHGPAS